MSRLGRKAARRRCDAASEGWHLPYSDGTIARPRDAADAAQFPDDQIDDMSLCATVDGDSPVILRRADAKFIVGARTDLPAALDLLDRCESLLREYWEASEALMFSGTLPGSPERDAVRELVPKINALLADLEAP